MQCDVLLEPASLQEESLTIYWTVHDVLSCDVDEHAC